MVLGSGPLLGYQRKQVVFIVFLTSPMWLPHVEDANGKNGEDNFLFKACDLEFVFITLPPIPLAKNWSYIWL